MNLPDDVLPGEDLDPSGIGIGNHRLEVHNEFARHTIRRIPGGRSDAETRIRGNKGQTPITRNVMERYGESKGRVLTHENLPKADVVGVEDDPGHLGAAGGRARTGGYDEDKDYR
jgi:hypothetical protein